MRRGAGAGKKQALTLSLPLPLPGRGPTGGMLAGGPRPGAGILAARARLGAIRGRAWRGLIAGMLPLESRREGV